MTPPPSLSLMRLGSLLGDPTRSTVVSTLMDGRALTAGELATAAGVAPQTMSSHLARLCEAGLLSGATQGRHRYFRLAGAEVAQALEHLMGLQAGGSGPAPVRATVRTGPADAALRRARICYDHLAGELGVAVFGALLARGALVADVQGLMLSPDGQALLGTLGVNVAETGRPRRRFGRPCLDWSERRDHLAGALGAALLARMLELGWFTRSTVSPASPHHALARRTLHPTPAGLRGLHEHFGVAPGGATMPPPR